MRERGDEVWRMLCCSFFYFFVGFCFMFLVFFFCSFFFLRFAAHVALWIVGLDNSEGEPRVELFN